MIEGLHHNAYRCRDSEETRRFYEDFLELPLAQSLLITESKTGRDVKAMHTFYQLRDGSFLAFFDVPADPFDFKEQDDYDLHVALEVEPAELRRMFEKGKIEGHAPRGVVDHGTFHSIYFRDPNGYVIELCSKVPDYDQRMAMEGPAARERLDAWQADKTAG